MEATRKHTLGPAGFTLVELLVAIAITLIFGIMAAKTLSAGAGMWRDGHRRSYAYDTATVVFQQLGDDLNAAKSQFWGTEADAYDARIKFWAGFDSYPGGGRQWLRFVRGIPDFSVNPRVRSAGTVAGATGYYNLIDNSSDLRPLEGMCEVAYMMGLGNDGSADVTDPATLYRAVLAPIGDTSLTADDAGYTFFGDLATENAFDTSQRIYDKALPLAQGVIYFELRLWSQYTTAWAPALSAYAQPPAAPAVPFAAWPNSYTPQDCGAVYTWDSTRIPNSGPAFDMDQNQQGPMVNGDAISDNVFPRSLMAIVTVEPPAELQGANPLRLRGAVGDSDMTLLVIGNGPPFNTEWPYVKIDDEWVRIDLANSSLTTGTIAVAQRGVRGTVRAPHNGGAPVHIGYTFSRVFSDPAVREYWGQ